VIETRKERFDRVHLESDRRSPFLIADRSLGRQPKAPCERGPISRLLERIFAS
jgi:hypothetical protein